MSTLNNEETAKIFMKLLSHHTGCIQNNVYPDDY
jgi:hypothetical protein